MNNASLLGFKFGMLKVVTHVQGQLWACECACGKVVPRALEMSLRSGLMQDCGCVRLGRVMNWGKHQLKEKKIKDLKGQVFGEWTVLGYAGKMNNHPMGQTVWKCRCSCGVIKEKVLYGSLTSGRSLSCGHGRGMRLGELKATHGLCVSHKAHYSIWQSIKTRCYNKNHPSYRRYGGVGIVMADEWITDFKQFVSDVGPRLSKSWRLARIDPEQPYTRSNVRWVSKKDKICGRGEKRCCHVSMDV